MAPPILAGAAMSSRSSAIHLPLNDRPYSRKPRRPSRFTMAEVARVMKAARMASYPVKAIRIEPDGAIVVIPGVPEVMPSSEGNPWDH
jgi:hypothetical protein